MILFMHTVSGRVNIHLFLQWFKKVFLMYIVREQCVLLLIDAKISGFGKGK